MYFKKTKKLAVLAGLTLLASSVNVFAVGEANGQWLKLKFKTQNGLQVNIADGATVKSKSTGTCYTQLIYTAVNPNPPFLPFYTGDVICEDSPGNFVSTPSGLFLFELPGASAGFAIDDFVSYGNSSGHVVSGYSSQQAVFKLNRSGGIKTVTLRSNGELVGSSLDPSNTDLILAGGYTVIGKLIPVSKLPFTP